MVVNLEYLLNEKWSNNSRQMLYALFASNVLQAWIKDFIGEKVTDSLCICTHVCMFVYLLIMYSSIVSFTTHRSSFQSVSPSRRSLVLAYGLI